MLGAHVFNLGKLQRTVLLGFRQCCTGNIGVHMHFEFLVPLADHQGIADGAEIFPQGIEIDIRIRLADNVHRVISKSNLFGVKNADPNLVGLNITDLKGNSYLVEGPMYNFSERAYFKNALNGKETVFGPINNKVTNIPTIFYGAPLYDDDGNLINTFFLAAHGETLSKICEQNRIGVDGKAVIIRRTTGLVIADIDEDAILKNNAYDDAADSGVKELQRITTDIAAGESGFAFIKLPDGSTVVNGYAPINGTDWSIIVRANYADFTAPLKHQRMLVILFSAIVLVLSGVILFFTYGKKQKSAKSE